MEVQGTITSRNITQVTGDLRYTITLDDGTVVVAFIKPAQIDTMVKLGDKPPKVNEKVYCTVSDVVGRDGTVFATLSL